MQIVCDGGLVQLHHRGVLIATHARRHALDKQTAGLHRGERLRQPPPRQPSASSVSVTRKVDSSGNVSFAGTNFGVANKYLKCDRRSRLGVAGEREESGVGAAG